jgi:hypothetical protein
MLTELPLSVATSVVVWLLLTPPVCMENVAFVAPDATVTELGTLKEPVLVAWRATFNPPAGAAADRVMVQVEDACAVNTVEMHANPFSATTGGGVSVSVKFREVPLIAAASTAVVLMLTVDRLTVNPAEAEPAATITEDGIATLADPPLNDTAAPAPGAGTDKPTVQLAEPGVVTVDGVQESDEIVGGGGARARVKVCEVPFKLAASTAVVFALTVDALAVNPAEFEPAGIKTDDGIVTPDPEARPVVTVSPPAGAGAETVTVHAAEPGVVIVAGEQTSPVAMYGEVMVT